MLSLGLLRRDAGLVDAYMDGLNAVAIYVGNMGYDTVVDSIEAAKSDAVADVLRGIGEEYGFDAETCDEVAPHPFDEAFEIAYGHILQAGLDPDILLGSFTDR